MTGDTTESKQSSLEDLVVDEQKLNEELVTDLLAPYIDIGGDSGAIIPKAAIHELTSKKRIAVLILSQLALHELEYSDSEWISRSELIKITGDKEGTVDPALNGLRNDNLIGSDDGRYRVPRSRIERVRTLLGDE